MTWKGKNKRGVQILILSIGVFRRSKDQNGGRKIFYLCEEL